MSALPEVKWDDHKPRVGQILTYAGQKTGKVHRVEDSLCWVDYPEEREIMPFIWCFHDGLNALHEWPTKNAKAEAP